MSNAPTRKPCPCGYCAPLREIRRRLNTRQNHPHYAARGNEQPLLQELIERDPPEGGMASYIADIDRKHG
jgi:hypothetical protein